METLNASDAKREFGELLLRVQKEPVGINRNGKPVAVVLSARDYEYIEQLRSDWLKAEIQKGMDDIASGNVIDGEIVFANLRQQVRNATP